MTALLFDNADLPRRASIQRMRVADAGNGPGGGKVIQFICQHCSHDTDWIADEWAITENRRGQSRPRCNP